MRELNLMHQYSKHGVMNMILNKRVLELSALIVFLPKLKMV